MEQKPLELPMKKLSRSTVLMYAVYTAMCLLSATLSDGAFAFGIFVGAILLLPGFFGMAPIMHLIMTLL